MDGEKGEFEEMVEKVSGQIGYEQLVLFQVNRIAQIISKPLAPGQYKHEFSDAVENLYQLLSPYVDAKYTADFSKLMESYEQNKKSYGEYGFAQSNFGLLMQLLDRLGLLLTRDGSGKFEV